MNAGPSRRPPAFTLVELLTVVAIIVLLIGILIPTLSHARMQAKASFTATLLATIGNSCEMFQGDLKHYPRSRGYNPFEPAGDNIILMGAQWLALQLHGPDGRGFVNPDLKNDANRDGLINDVDWLDWYTLPQNQIDPTRQYTRLGPYVDVDAKQVRTVQRILDESPGMTIPDGLVPGTNGGQSEWNNAFIPFFVDAFEFPILYYAANAKVDEPFTTGTGVDIVVGRYDQSDNAAYTGSEGENGRYPVSSPGWDLTGTAEDPSNYRSALGEFHYVEDQTTVPDSATFEDYVYNAQTFESTRVGDNGRIWPHNPDTFLLISAGADGIYGTGDDVTNFQR